MPPALIIVDVQKAIDQPFWSKVGPRNNPLAETRMAQLLVAWREHGFPIIHIRHDSVEPDSTYKPGQPGHEIKAEVTPLPRETIIAKPTGSAFVHTSLEQHLKESGIATLVVCGVITNNSVDTTVRHAGDLGFQTYLVEDACFTFARRDWCGVVRSAEEIHAMSLANLDGEYCEVTSTDQVIQRFCVAGNDR